MAGATHARALNDKSHIPEVRDDKGNTLPSEIVQALKRTGNPKAGKPVYQALCEACHMPSGAGNPDGMRHVDNGVTSKLMALQLTFISAARSKRSRSALRLGHCQ